MITLISHLRPKVHNGKHLVNKYLAIVLTSPYHLIQMAITSHQVRIPLQNQDPLSHWETTSISNKLVCLKKNMMVSMSNLKKTWIQAFISQSSSKIKKRPLRTNTNYTMVHRMLSCLSHSFIRFTKEFLKLNSLLNLKLSKTLKTIFQKESGLSNSKANSKLLLMNGSNTLWRQYTLQCVTATSWTLISTKTLPVNF